MEENVEWRLILFQFRPTHVIAFETIRGDGWQAANFGLCKFRDHVEGDNPHRSGQRQRLRTGLSGWRCHLWLYTEEWGSPECAAHLVQKFLKKFRPDDCWSLTYSVSCSKPRVGEYGGGAVFVTAADVRWDNAHEAVEQERAAIERAGEIV